MKNRTGYVSNSSSSSFVVVPDEVAEEYERSREVRSLESYASIRLAFELLEGDGIHDGKWLGLFPEAETRFGWQNVNYHGLKDKWNWIVLQAFYAKGTYIDEIDRYAKSIGVCRGIDWGAIDKAVSDGYAYIDHQSISAEDTFGKVSRVGIDEFLTNEKCHVHNGNDQEEYEEGEEIDEDREERYDP